jgi:hypothetical protein
LSDPYKYDGLVLDCDDTAGDSLTLHADITGVSIAIVEDGNYSSVFLSPKKARKLAKALKALATTAEDNANG